ncbi:hypothetical protein GYMLUDRAFT_49739, partial [Collybiopsis luxurians FD-317 M1]
MMANTSMDVSVLGIYPVHYLLLIQVIQVVQYASNWSQMLYPYPQVPPNLYLPPCPAVIIRPNKSSTSTCINHNLPRQAAAAASLVVRAALLTPAAHQTKRRMKKGLKRLKKQTVQFPSFGAG